MIVVEIAGRLGRDPETRFTPSGQKVTNLNVATNIRKGGKEETVWWRVTIWGDRFDKLLVHLKKGSAVIIIGEMNKPEIWIDKEGKPQVSLDLTAEIIKFSPFGSPDRPQDQTGTTQQGQQAQQYTYNQNSPSTSQDFGNENYSSNPYGSAQGVNKNYSSNVPAEDPLPF